jgi:hypothetical protein
MGTYGSGKKEGNAAPGPSSVRMMRAFSLALAAAPVTAVMNAGGVPYQISNPNPDSGQYSTGKSHTSSNVPSLPRSASGG